MTIPNDNIMSDTTKDAVSVGDAEIKACALMIKGICMTRPQEKWASDIESRIRFMLSRAPAQVQAEAVAEWQPIETAPEDGNCLLAIATDDGYTFGALYRDKRGNWIHEGEPTFCHSYYFEPTHWMPLPAAPTPSTGDQS